MLSQFLYIQYSDSVYFQHYAHAQHQHCPHPNAILCTVSHPHVTSTKVWCVVYGICFDNLWYLCLCVCRWARFLFYTRCMHMKRCLLRTNDFFLELTTWLVDNVFIHSLVKAALRLSFTAHELWHCFTLLRNDRIQNINRYCECYRLIKK